MISSALHQRPHRSKNFPFQAHLVHSTGDCPNRMTVTEQNAIHACPWRFTECQTYQEHLLPMSEQRRGAHHHWNQYPRSDDTHLSLYGLPVTLFMIHPRPDFHWYSWHLDTLAHPNRVDLYQSCILLSVFHSSLNPTFSKYLFFSDTTTRL